MKIRMLVAAVLALTTVCAIQPQEKYPPQTKNAALRYWMAFAEMQDPPADATTQQLLEKTVAGNTPWDEKQLGAILDANSAAIQMMQRATRLPECDWGLEFDQGPRASIAYAPRARVLSRLNTLQGMRQMAGGDSQAAVDTWLAGIRFSGHLASGGPLIFTLIGKSMLLPNLHALSTEAQAGHFSAAQKSQITAQLKPLHEDIFDWASAWQMEGLGGERFLNEVLHAKDPAATYQLLSGQPMPSNSRMPTPEDFAKYRRYVGEVRAALNLPPDASKARIVALEPQRTALPTIAQWTIPNAQKENEARAEVIAARHDLLKVLAER